MCPCCGHLFIVAAVPVVDADALTDSEAVVAKASELGIEIGVLEGGEEIGD